MLYLSSWVYERLFLHTAFGIFRLLLLNTYFQYLISTQAFHQLNFRNNFKRNLIYSLVVSMEI